MKISWVSEPLATLVFDPYNLWMRIYLDACCVNRPFDDQTQQRVRIESEAIRLILEACGQGSHRWVTSEVVEDELRRTPDAQRRSMALDLLRFADEHLMITPQAIALARGYVTQGIGPVDALHLALAEAGACDMLLTTDDDFVRRARSVRPAPNVNVDNPARWVMENAEHGA